MAQAAKQQNGAAQIILMTNGLLLPKVGPQIAEHVNTFDISLDGDPVAHAWMRGSDAFFEKTVEGVDWVVANTDKRVGIIATAVHANLPDGRQQIESIAPLAEILRKRYGDSGQISLSVSLYYGAPSDPLRLTTADLIRLVELLTNTGFPVRILWTVSYAHLFPAIREQFRWNMTSLQWDVPTNLPILRVGPWLDIIPFHLSASEQLVLRLGNRGYIHLGCDHLDLGSEAEHFAVGTLGNPFKALEEAKKRSRGILDPRCQTCAHFSLCRGGDPHSGLLHSTPGYDPYCPLLN
jgi:radical SAM protein with 4Fe4S-binding SPASM domain